MILKAPFFIGSRLLPTLKVGDAELSLEYTACCGNKLVYKWYIDLDGVEYSRTDLNAVPQGSDAATDQATFAALCGFLSACGESVAWSLRTSRRKGDNADLFPPKVGEWASANTDELSCLASNLEENEGLLADSE